MIVSLRPLASNRLHPGPVTDFSRVTPAAASIARFGHPDRSADLLALWETNRYHPLTLRRKSSVFVWLWGL